MERKYWGYAVTRAGKRQGKELGPFPTRQAAKDAVWQAWPKARAVVTGYGEGGGFFDIRHEQTA